MSNLSHRIKHPRPAGQHSDLDVLIAWTAPVLLMIVIFMMSSEPSYGEQDYIARRLELGLLPAWLTPFAPFLDRYLSSIVHVGEYGLLALLLANAHHRTPRLQPLTGRAAWLLATLYGVSDELHQSFVPGRHASWQDLAFNAVGAGLGVAVWLLFVKHRRPSQTPP